MRIGFLDSPPGPVAAFRARPGGRVLAGAPTAVAVVVSVR